MRVSVIINTFNRAVSLAGTLDALRLQTHDDFEVIVVDGPSDDGTHALLARRADAVRSLRFEERNLSKSRNLGIDAAAGEIVAFIDDDAIPEARWLEDLVAAYDAPEVGGAGGLTLDASGTLVQYRYSVCDRLGNPDFDRLPPFDDCNRPGADPFLYLQGTNASFRRSALEAVEGFDEEIEYNYDESEVCSRIIDAGLQLRALERAAVHHKVLPSHQRDDGGFTDPFLMVKNRVYFGLRAALGFHSRRAALAAIGRSVETVRESARDAARRGHLTPDALERFLERADAGFELGLERGLAGQRRGRAIIPADPSAFLPYPTLRAAGERRTLAFAGDAAAARKAAAAGHEVHLFVPDDPEPFRSELEDGVWVHRFPVAERFAPELDGRADKPELDARAALHSAIARVGERVPFDAVEGAGEPLSSELPAALLDTERFPDDPEAALHAALAEALDEAFLTGAFAALFRRAPDDMGRFTFLPRLGAGASRLDVLRELIGSDEAAAHGVAPAILDRLPVIDAAEAHRRLVAASFATDDADFAAQVAELALGDDAAAPAGDRVGIAQSLLADPRAQRRIAGSRRLDLGVVREVPALLVQVENVPAKDDEAFVEILYRLLLGRDPDPPSRQGYVGRLRGGQPRTLIAHEIARSPEAAGRGVPADVPGRLVAALLARERLRDQIGRHVRRRVRAVRRSA